MSHAAQNSKFNKNQALNRTYTHTKSQKTRDLKKKSQKQQGGPQGPVERCVYSQW